MPPWQATASASRNANQPATPMKTNTPRRSHLHRAVSKKQLTVRTACSTKLWPLLLWLLLTLPAVVQAQFNYTTNNGAITISKYTGTSSF